MIFIYKQKNKRDICLYMTTNKQTRNEEKLLKTITNKFKYKF